MESKVIKNSPIVLKTLGHSKKYPYFFKNENIDNNIYIVQRADNINKALYIIDIWNNERFNPGESIHSLDGSKFAYDKYLYNSNNQIYKKEINGGNENYKVLLYKKDGKIYTSALLKFD